MASHEVANGASSPDDPDTVTSQAPSAVGDEVDMGGKLWALLSVLGSVVTATDIASVPRFSLPVRLMEPVPNLEYWTYLDRPETFTSMADPEDELGRMLAVVRFYFAKDLRFTKGRPVKPYNSNLGEFFRCNWIVDNEPPKPFVPTSNRSSSGAAPIQGENSSSGSSPTPPTANGFIATENSSPELDSPPKVSLLCEQTCHHPPVSAFYIECPQKQITASGFDQIVTNFKKFRIRVEVSPGKHNRGIFVNLNKWGEEYHLTHPNAFVNISLPLIVSISGTSFIRCSKSNTKVIIQYSQGLFSTPHGVKGVIYRYDPENDDIFKSIEEVPEKKILARIEGIWKLAIYYTIGNAPFSKERQHILIDLGKLSLAAKRAPAFRLQQPNESRSLWRQLTMEIKAKQFNEAQQTKLAMEEAQREKALKRKKGGVDWKPKFFIDAVNLTGKPKLNAAGEAALKGIHLDDWKLPEESLTEES